MLSLLDFRSRFAYLDMLGQLERGDETSHTLEKIRAMDQLMSEPLVLTEEQLQKAVGGDKEKRKQIAVFLMHHEILRQEGAWVPYQLNSGQLRLVLLLESSVLSYKSFNVKLELLCLTSILTKTSGRLEARGKGKTQASSTSIFWRKR